MKSDSDSIFSITDSNNDFVIFKAETNNEMMRWILALRIQTFHKKGISMDNFDILSVIGRGFFGKVMLVKEKNSGRLFAIKSIRKSKLLEKNRLQSVISERLILGKICHPFIVSLEFAFQTPSKFYFGLEYAPGGELFYHMERRDKLPYEEVVLYIAEIAIALKYLHDNNIIYRDLKPENVLLDAEGHIKLTDFGLAKDLSDVDFASTMCGTVEYMAPEIIQHQHYGKSVDWWALGILTYELFYGQTPFFNQNKSKIMKSIVQSQPKFPKNVDPVIRDFILFLLEKDPNQRPDFEQIKVNDFFKKLDFDEVYKKKIKPSYVPSIDANNELRNFDSEFTNELAIDSLSQPVLGSNVEIENFSFIGNNFENYNQIDDTPCSLPCSCICMNPTSPSQLDLFNIDET